MTQGDTVEVALGASFVIALESSPTAGYTWSEEHDPAMLDLVRANDLRDPPPGVGGGGVEEFEFRARSPGETTVRLTYGRPWEAEPRSSRTYGVRIS